MAIAESVSPDRTTYVCSNMVAVGNGVGAVVGVAEGDNVAVAVAVADAVTVGVFVASGVLLAIDEGVTCIVTVGSNGVGVGLGVAVT